MVSELDGVIAAVAVSHIRFLLDTVKLKCNILIHVTLMQAATAAIKTAANQALSKKICLLSVFIQLGFN